MKIKCQYTGRIISYQHFPNTTQVLHGYDPIFALPTASLLLLANAPELATQDTRLLFLALLNKLPLVKIVEQISLDTINKNTAEYYIPSLVRAIHEQPKVFQAMPNLWLSNAAIKAGGLLTWLEYLKDVMTDGGRQSILDYLNPKIADIIRISNARKASGFKLIATWAIDKMLTNAPGFSSNGLKTLQGILLDNTPTNLDYMRDLKGRLLDYLPESNGEEAFWKRTVLEKVDYCIIDALQMAYALGTHTNNTINEELAVLSSTYTIEGIINTAAMPAKKIKGLQELMAGQDSQLTQKPAPVLRSTYPLAKILANPILNRLYSIGKIEATP